MLASIRIYYDLFLKHFTPPVLKETAASFAIEFFLSFPFRKKTAGRNNTAREYQSWI
jgi:hypothetical protein